MARKKVRNQLADIVAHLIECDALDTARDIITHARSHCLGSAVEKGRKVVRSIERGKKPEKTIDVVEGMLKSNMNTKQIARKLGISERSVVAYKANITRRR